MRETNEVAVKAETSGNSAEQLYRELPSVNDLLLEPLQPLLQVHARIRVVDACRAALEEIRQDIACGVQSRETLEGRIADLPKTIEKKLNQRRRYSLRRVINATGVLLHTNLGRAPLSRKALEHVVDIAGGYSNLEFDLESGERGKRDVHVESLILALLLPAAGADACAVTHRAVVVNNCAAATYLALHALAKGKEVLVSRGELVEIGGGFRIPEILEESGAQLREIGTTNRTRIADYDKAVSPNTGLILRVHPSNFSMDGFVERPALEELVALGRRVNIPVFEDQGTGLVHSLDDFGIAGEPTLVKSLGAGCDLVAASGDKLFGGPQCGILVGKTHLIDAIRKHPLFRTYRVDKLSYAVLEATLHQYHSGAAEEIPVIGMLRMGAEAVRSRCACVANALDNSEFAAEVIEVESVLGGGTAPTARLKSAAIALTHAALDAEELLGALRGFDPPVIGRIADDRVLLDLRTVEPGDDSHLIEALKQVPSSHVTSPES
ncbi:MAG TPA: L-seryl-tRNA(Sec) selenium transferase [Terracidiphilus sp.]|jgi:L-seryl-tRNA(Ser) seleniumtransferase|nr:L-seryl-tRNA(Sec) selenium transferase [Terracidiphilus sp.]